MHFLELLSRVEEILREVVRRCYPTSWNEDHITYSITDDLTRELRSVQVHGVDRPFKTTWDARKLRGHAERSFGDLAVVVRLKSWSGEEVHGVGLIEAKRRDDKGGSFPAIRKRQLETVLRHAPSSRVLLYDYSQITEFEDNLPLSCVWDSPRHLWPPVYSGEHPSVTPYSHCVVVPTSMILATGLKTTGLYKYSVPFSVQLCSRYLRGFDLELRDTAVSKVNRFINQNGGPRYLLLVGVSTGDAEAVLPEWVNNDSTVVIWGDPL